MGSQVAGLVAGVAGAVVGFMLGGPLGASIGWMAGSTLGSALFPPKGPDGPRLSDLKLQASQYGTPIPIVYGTVRISGFVFWQTDLKEHQSTSGGKGGHSKGGTTTYSYSASFAVGLCEGPIVGVKRIWADSRIIWENGKTVGTDGDLPVAFYLGDERQGADPTMEAHDGVGNVPGYRGIAYAMFTDLDLSPYFNRIPNLTFEVSTVPGGVSGNLLHRYSTWAVDPGLPAFGGDGSAYSYPYGLNGQSYNTATGVLTSVQWRAYVDYHSNTDPHYYDGFYSVGYWEHDLKGQHFVDRTTPSSPWPYGHTTQPAGLPYVIGPEIRGSMNSGGAYTSGQVLMYWPDGTNSTHWHPVDGWETNIPNETVLAPYPDSVGLPWMGVNGSIWLYDDALYATGGGTGIYLNDAWIRKYSVVQSGARAGQVSRSPVAEYEFPSYGVGYGYCITASDDGYIYVLGMTSDGNDASLYKFDKDLVPVRIWHGNPGDPTDDRIYFNTNPYGERNNIGIGYSAFAVYGNYIVIYQFDGTNPKAMCYLLNDDDTTTFVNDVLLSVISPVIQLGDSGYMAVRDGILVFGNAASGGGVSWASIVNDISARVGLASTEYDTSAVPYMVRGYVVSQQGPARQAVDQLKDAFFVDAVESDTAIKYVPRGSTALATIDDSDLGAKPSGQPPVGLFQRTRTREGDLPRVVNVSYMNQEADYQVGTQSAHRQVTSSLVEVSVQWPIVFSDAEAKAVADRMLLEAWVGQQHATVTVNMKLAHYEPTDVLNFSVGSYRIVAKNESQNEIIAWEMIAVASSVFVQAAPPGDTGGQGGGSPVTGQKTDLIPLDIPLPTDTSFANGFPTLMGGASRSDWAGATLYESVDGGSTYAQVATGDTADTYGYTTTVLGDWTGGNVFDETNTVTVGMSANDGTLESTTQDAVLNGSNEGLIGSEIVFYRDATLVAPSTYTLSGLLRGRRGTEWATGTHQTNEVFAVLPAQNNFQAEFAEIGQLRYFKAVTSGNIVSKAAAVAFTNTGIALKPYAPVLLGGGYDGSGNVTLNWTRRDRKAGAWVDFVEIPMSEPTETYIVQIWDSTYTLCARILTVVGAQTVTYTSAQQTTDFGATQQTVYFTVGQLGSVSLGSQARGYAAGAGVSTTVPSAPIAPYAFDLTVAPPPTNTRTPDHVFTVPDSVILSDLVVGQTWVGQFTTPSVASPAGHIAISEYGGIATLRHAWIATDSGGKNKVAKGEGYGTTVTCFIGALSGGAVLAGSTTYYFFTDFLMADGTLAEPSGTAAPSIVNLMIE